MICTMKHLLLSFPLLASLAFAELEMPAIFSDGMVLQRETKASVWGWADPGAEVTASFQGQKHKAKAGKDGKWIITFEGLEAASDPATLEISAGKEKAVISDVVVRPYKPKKEKKKK